MLRAAFGFVVATVGVIGVMTAVGRAQGNGPGFHASAFFGGGCSGSQVVSAPNAPASAGPLNVTCISGTGQAAAQAGAGTLRASSRSAHVCCGTSSGANGSARIQINDIVITGPAAASIPISLNFHLRGSLTGQTEFGQAGVSLFLRVAGFNTNLSSTSAIDFYPAGILNQTGVFAPLTIGFPNAAIDHTFTTHQVNAAPNQPLQFDLQLMAYSDMAGQGVTESDFFSDGNGFALPSSGPVFNLPPGYTVNIPALNIADNHIGGGGSSRIEVPILTDLVSFFRLNLDGDTGFTVNSRDNSLFRLNGLAQLDLDAGRQPGETVQEGFLLLDGTLSLELSAIKENGTRAPLRTTFRMNVPRSALRRDSIARALVRQGVVPDLTRARTRAGAIRLNDARVMRLVENRNGGPAQWTRAVRALRTPRRIAFRPRVRPDGVIGHFGTVPAGTDGPFVWAVMDRNSRYAVGITVDRDNDGVPNSSDNCIGSANSNQLNADGDAAGDACDLDDDNDLVLDDGDNCSLTANADQADHDHDGIGNACDFDDDNDRVLDGDDRCLATPAGSIVDATGCSIAESCPCASDWRNHGAYVKCVAKTSGEFLAAGLITSGQKDAIVSTSAKSSCGY